MDIQFISLNKAAGLVNKSTQTIRRLIKSNKIKFRRKRTPQGFIYFIDQKSLIEVFEFRPRLEHDLINHLPSDDFIYQQNPPIKADYHNVDIEIENPQYYEEKLNQTEYPTTRVNPDIYMLETKAKNEASQIVDVSKDVQVAVNVPAANGDLSLETDGKELLINQKDQMMSRLVEQNQKLMEQNQKLMEAKDYELRRNQDLINQLQEQLNSLFRIMESLQAGYQRLLNPPKRWWHFWK